MIYTVSDPMPGGGESRKMTDVLPGFFAAVTDAFVRYEKGGGSDPKADLLFASVAGLTVTDEDYRDLLEQINRLLLPYLDRAPERGTCRRTIAMVGMPPQTLAGEKQKEEPSC